MSKRQLVKSVKFSGEPVLVNEDGSLTPYISHEIVGNRSAYAACLHLVFQHTADVHITMMEILAEKYGLSVNDMIETVTKEARFKDMMINPALNGMGYFGPDTVEQVVEAPALVSVEDTDMEMVTEKMADASITSTEVPTLVPPPAAKPKKVIRVKKAAVAVAPPS
jgi:propanediol dehydratase large subunit